MQLDHHVERVDLALVHIRHGWAELGEDETLPGEYQGERAACWAETTEREPAEELATQVRTSSGGGGGKGGAL